MTHFLNRRHLVAISTLVALIGALIAVVHPYRASAATPVCEGQQLVETISSLPGGETAGTDYLQLTFTNLGGTCELRGYPGVSAVNIRGEQMGEAAVRETGAQPEVTLKAETQSSAASAYETIGFVNTSALSGCDQQLAAGLRIYAPGSTTAKYVPFVVDACTTKVHSYMEIRPIH